MASRQKTKTNSFAISLTEETAKELGRCYQDVGYFINKYCHIYDAVAGEWVPFDLWDAQADTLRTIHLHQLTVILKARQLGMTWLVLAYALWLMVFRPVASIMLYSRRDTDAIYLLSDDRLRGMFARLPDWMKSGHDTTADNAHEWGLETGSIVRAFPTTAGDSYTSTLVVVDEADLSPDLNALMRAVKPTIDNGGKMVLLSRADKSSPVSEFKNVYINAVEGKNDWVSVFLPWWTHPKRDDAWYQRQIRDIQSRTGSLDDLYEQYPATDIEAIKPREMDKRIPYVWLTEVYQSLDGDDLLGMQGLTVYKKPEKGREYVIGADPAEGNPNSDDSAATVMDVDTGEEVAVLVGKLQPSFFANSIVKLASWYEGAGLMVERNNHGHAILLKLQEDEVEGILEGMDDKPGWLNSAKGKAMMYSAVVDAIRDKHVTIHNFGTYQQLASIEGSTLKAPEGLHDDRATSFALAWLGRIKMMEGSAVMMQAPIQGRGFVRSAPLTGKVVSIGK
jgi:hypothetical protein